MVKGILKNTGKNITAVILLVFFALPLYAADIKSELTRERINTGETSTLKVMISGTTSDIRPVKMPALDGLSISLSGTSRSFQFINGKSWAGVILSFTIEAEKKGVYRIPPLVLEADGEMLKTKEFILTVDEGSGTASAYTGTLKGEIELTASEIYAGEPVIMRYYIRSNASDIRIEGMKEQPESKGFVIKDLKESALEEIGEGDDGRRYIASYCLVAAESGKHEIGGGALSVIAETGDGFFSRIIRREIRFPKKTVNVKSLPAKGKPDQFNGDVGEFTIEAGEATGSFRAGEEIRIPVKVRGRGNLLMMSKPLVENQEGMKLLVEEGEPLLSVDNRTLAGEKSYTVTVIPAGEGECRMGRIYLNYFNPYKGVYEKAETAPLLFKVSPHDRVKDSGGDTASEEKSSMPLIILIAAIGVIAACGVILYLQTGRYRIVKAETLHEPKPEPEQEKPADRDSIIRGEFEKAYAGKDQKKFLQNAERLTGLIDTLTMSESALDELGRVRDMINRCRYGGGSLSEEDMRQIYSVIKKGF